MEAELGAVRRYSTRYPDSLAHFEHQLKLRKGMRLVFPAAGRI